MVDRRTFEMEAGTRAISGETSFVANLEHGCSDILAVADVFRGLLARAADVVTQVADDWSRILGSGKGAGEPIRQPPPWRGSIVPFAARSLVAPRRRHFRRHRIHGWYRIRSAC